MMNVKMRIVLLVLFIMSTLPIHGQEVALQEGDRVVFYGDSITAQRLYTRFVEDFVLTRNPNLHVSFWNAGVPGDTAYGGYTGNVPTRLKRDMLPYRPTVVTVMLGMNDGYYMEFNPKYLEVFENGYRQLLGSIKSTAPTARVALISPTPYDEATHGTEFPHYNETISHHAAFVKELADSSHLGFSDFNRAETELLQAGKEKNPLLAKLLIVDRIHPAEASQWVMAAALARSLGISPVVSSLRLDAAHGKTVAMQNTEISDFSMKDGGLQWTQTDKALPLPLQLDDEMIQFVISISDLTSMDQQILRVDGLTAASYALKIDGHRIASFTREQCASGVNLALHATPMESQAKGVDGIEAKRTQLDEAHFILAVETVEKSDGDAAVTKAFEARDTALQEEQRKAVQPKPHRFELSPE